MNTQTIRKICLLLVPISLLVSIRASAFVVIDPANLAQNVLQAIRLLQSNINEAKQIANQVKSLANEAKNLASLKIDTISDFNSKLSNLFTTVGSINGLMQNLSEVQSRFEELYPDLANKYNTVPRVAMSEDMRQWITTTREMVLGASETGAQVLENLPKSKDSLDKLLASSQGAVGILQATQAGNQIAATISENLIHLNAQLATYAQAHNAFLMELNSASGAAKNRMDHVLDGWAEPSSSAPIAENPF